MEGEPKRPAALNYVRRTIGAAICLGPAVVLVASLFAVLAYPRRSGWGVGIASAGLFVGGFNFYLAVIRPLLHALRHGSSEGLRRVSGVPLLGTLLATAGGAVGFGDWRSAAIGLVILAIDLGGLPWFLIATWRDDSLWDA